VQFPLPGAQVSVVHGSSSSHSTSRVQHAGIGSDSHVCELVLQLTSTQVDASPHWSEELQQPEIGPDVHSWLLRLQVSLVQASSSSHSSSFWQQPLTTA
jgi:hypothetical protein